MYDSAYWVSGSREIKERIPKSGSHLPKKIFLFAWMIVLKNDEKCFLFHLKGSFRPQDV